MLLGDLLQHPVTPVQNAAKMATKAMINSAIIDLPMSVTEKNSGFENKNKTLDYGLVCCASNGGFLLFRSHANVSRTNRLPLTVQLIVLINVVPDAKATDNDRERLFTSYRRD